MPGIVGTLSVQAPEQISLADVAAGLLRRRWQTLLREQTLLGEVGLVASSTMARREPLFRAADGTVVALDGWLSNADVLRGRCGLASGTPDAAVIAGLFRREGEAAFDALDGSFNLCLVHAAAREVFLVSDPYGNWPLYYLAGASSLCFGPELKVVRAATSQPFRVDWSAMGHAIAFGCPFGDITYVKGVRVLGAGSVLRWTPGEAHTRRYWQLPYGGDEGGADCSSWAARLGDAMDVSISPVAGLGAELTMMLSGGLDSRLIAGHLRERRERFVARGLTWKGRPNVDSVTSERIARTLGLPWKPLPWSADAGEELLAEFLDMTDGTADCQYLFNGYALESLRDDGEWLVQGNNGNHLFGDYATSYFLAVANLVNQGLDVATWRERCGDRVRMTLLYELATKTALYENRAALFIPEVARLAEQASVQALSTAAAGRPDLDGFRLHEYVQLTQIGRRKVNTSPWLCRDWIEVVNPLFVRRELAETTTAMPLEWKISRVANFEHQALRFPDVALVPKAGGYTSMFRYPDPIVPGAEIDATYYDAHHVHSRQVAGLAGELIEGLCERDWVRGDTIRELWRRHQAGEKLTELLGPLISLEFFFRRFVDGGNRN